MCFMRLNKGDEFEIIEDNRKIILVPVAIYPIQVIENTKESVEEIKENIKNGKQAVFDSLDSLFEELHK